MYLQIDLCDLILQTLTNEVQGDIPASELCARHMCPIVIISPYFEHKLVKGGASFQTLAKKTL